ncbi:ParB/RepB/Spo0J family partition protein [Pontibacter sp. JH31]|uniref:ParB/RepB/Spo0J family partition protein n=1 Tax=Pontibacter aquaedesilientis TaxID=2766980 RepID=A0ABR7XH14_9BACT|nr:ParB/RepB/Spo0J family partition protein [Pontibacter aquaedesilientis]MBD1397565.1 ParB/RepB/Spo0J family partition protein [Pontibacter aquaedesilientis]
MSDKKSVPARKGGLGRGLGSLLEGNKYTGKTESSTLNEVNTIADIAIDHIQTNPYQPRTHFDQTALEELAESIRIQGIIQPITVRQLDQHTYQLISGERRYQAAKMAGLTTIPAYIRKADDQQMLEMALIENIQRENLNAIEIALSYQRLLTECSLKQEELGDRVGKKRTTVTNYLRLLKLPPDIQIALRDNVISMGHARALINIDTIEKQLEIFKKVVAEELSVRKVEELVRNVQNAGKKPDPQQKLVFNKYDEELKGVETRLSSQFGTKIMVKANNDGKGEIKIPFVSVEELNRILEILNY